MTGNGYESTGHRAVLLLFNMQNGTVFKKMDTGVGSAGTPNGLGPVTPVYDGSRNIVAAYAGDKLGNLWRFGMTDPDPANWTIRKVFVARDGANNPQPITTAPRVVLHPLGGLYVLFGTGKFFEVGDPADVSIQSVYGIWDKGGTLHDSEDWRGRFGSVDAQRCYAEPARTRCFGPELVDESRRMVF